MSIAVRKYRGVTRIRVEDEMTIYSAGEMKEALVGALSHGDEFEVTLEQVAELDSSGVQLLLAFKQACERDGKSIRFLKPSAPVLEVLETLKLDPLFEHEEQEHDGEHDEAGEEQ
ncbi:MAG: STAS domain-containing protein, partial [Halieaceae bacterium]|nr:STAS domain-containing protein [Halieaceae bacterium]